MEKDFTSKKICFVAAYTVVTISQDFDSWSHMILSKNPLLRPFHVG